MLKGLEKRTASIVSFVLLVLVAAMLSLSGCAVENRTEPVIANQLTRPEMVTSGDDALKLLKDGNTRFTMEERAVKDLSKAKRDELATGQKPFAIILSCSDSRVPPELIFDQGLGDLFVVRDAGNVVDQITLGSIEYAAEHLKVPLLVVLGHSKCGAVKATVEGGDVPPNIAAIAKKISPAVKVAEEKNTDEAKIIEAAVAENVKNVMRDVEDKSALLKELIESKKLKVVGAKYDLESGKVEWLEQQKEASAAE